MTKFVLTIMFDVFDLKYMVFVHIPIFISFLSVLLVFEVKSELSSTDIDKKS